MNKSLITNLLALGLVITGLVTTVYADVILSVGLFALSGALTNWLAIHMLFEKVPFLYGSGVIPNQFEDFKHGIRRIIMQEFFTTDNIQRFMNSPLEGEDKKAINLSPLLDAIDYDQIFQSLVEAISSSSLGSLLGMLGGVEALEPLREPVTLKLRASLLSMSESESLQKALQKNLSSEKLGADLSTKIEKVVNQRLDELTPQMVKEIIQTMIQKHLGWLVVWGAVFGGLIGFIAAFI